MTEKVACDEGGRAHAWSSAGLATNSRLRPRIGAPLLGVPHRGGEAVRRGRQRRMETTKRGADPMTMLTEPSSVPVAWRLRAKCRDHPNPDIFFPDTNEVDEARAVCARCPVRMECLETHLMERHGIWGGTTERERRRIRRQRRLAAEWYPTITKGATG